MRIYLRAFEIDDYKLISSWRHDSAMGDLVCGNRLFISSEREKKWVESKLFDDSKDIYCAICLVETDVMIGYISIINIDLRNRKAEWGGVTIGDKTMWGKGYAKLAIERLLEFAKSSRGIRKLYLYTLDCNEKARRIYKDLGFSNEGIYKSHVYKNGVYQDLHIQSIFI